MTEQTAQQPATQNTAALIGLGSGIVGLFVLPLLLGPVACIAGFVGLAHKDRVGTGHSVAAIILGILAIVIMFANIATAVSTF